MVLLTDDEVIDRIWPGGRTGQLLKKEITPKVLIMDHMNFFTYAEEGEELLQKTKIVGEQMSVKQANLF